MLSPAAALTSANDRPPANAWLINVCRPWWIVRCRSRSRQSDLHAAWNLSRIVWRISGSPSRFGLRQQINGSWGRADSPSRLRFHAFRSASVPASHQTLRSSPSRPSPPRDGHAIAVDRNPRGRHRDATLRSPIPATRHSTPYGSESGSSWRWAIISLCDRYRRARNFGGH